MRRLDGFIVYGSAALFALVLVLVLLSWRSNRSVPSIATVSVNGDPSDRPAQMHGNPPSWDCRDSSLSGFPDGVRQVCAAIASRALSQGLAANQRCYGGTVVQVNGTTYTQLMAGGRPVVCSGHSAYQPIR
jgi:hypothetical protein